MEERNTGEADFISKCVVEDLVENVINVIIKNDNAKTNDVNDKSAAAEDVTESLASALESLTEESARELLEEETSKSVIMSDKTSKIIKEFICNESKDKSKPVIDAEEEDGQAQELSLQVTNSDIVVLQFHEISLILQLFIS